ncbi:unnamed protein product [Linum tenue]|uniref:Uncharacterized protein n=1 Tax=Linum tenue TaxID=586396 RepID=A0AAV0KT11_9ROSI|nr:unnamed protein product [Linum tenue]
MISSLSIAAADSVQMPDKINDVDVCTEETKPLTGFSWAKKGRVEKYNILLDLVLSVIHKLEPTKLTGTSSSSNRSTISYCLHFLQNQKAIYYDVPARVVELQIWRSSKV